MKAIVLSIDRTCSLSTVPIPVPTEGEVLIKPVCVPVHTLDLLKIRGVLGSFSGIPGFEGAGSVIRVGPGSKSRKLAGK